jgi:hypothetical protein
MGLQMAIEAVRRNGPRQVAAGAAAGLGAAIAIGAMEGLSRTSHAPLVIIPSATSIVLVVGSPEAAFADVWHRWLRRQPGRSAGSGQDARVVRTG